jgi:hypothetical protein
MPSPAVVEELDVLKEGRAGRRARLPGGLVDELAFECREEALGDGIVPATENLSAEKPWAGG